MLHPRLGVILRRRFECASHGLGSKEREGLMLAPWAQRSKQLSKVVLRFACQLHTLQATGTNIGDPVASIAPRT